VDITVRLNKTIMLIRSTVLDVPKTVCETLSDDRREDWQGDSDIKRYIIIFKEVNKMETAGDYCVSCGQPLKPKRRDVKAFVAILLVVVIVFSSLLYMQYNSLQLRESAIKGLTEERDSLKLEVSDLETLKTSLENDKAMLEKAKLQLEQDKAKLEIELGHYKLKTPTRVELENFLLNDKTDKNEYRTGYVCINFACDLKANAARAGWNISYVQANYDVYYDRGKYFEDAHAFNMAILADGSIVYIDTYADTLYNSVAELLVSLYVIEYEPRDIFVTEIVIIW